MSDPQTARLEAALSDRYRIERKLGEGGMASVYLAEDRKHQRKVALKVLKPELAAVLGGERFLAEIRTTANLQHPHILPLFDSGEQDGFLYYVMPFIDGETLRDKLDREKQLGVGEAVGIAKSVADALDYAHRQGVIHRDIKPANILLHDGRPVVADFGIAVAVSAAGGGRMTETGLSLGTPHYMSPEQASADRDLTARSDVYSLGCVLYEMVAGQPPHTGPSAQSILVRILTETPRLLTELRHTVPPHVAAVVMKAIEKLPADRFESAKAFRDALDDEGFTYTARPVSKPAASPRPMGSTLAAGPSRMWIGVTAVLVLAAGAAGWILRGGDAAAPVTDSAVTAFVLSETYTTNRSPVIAPDGSILYYDREAGAGLTLRAAGSLESVPLEGANVVPAGGDNAAFSPDGRWLAFVENDGSGGKLRRMPAQGGPVSTLWAGDGESEARLTPEWSEDGWIYLYIRGALARVPEEGGPADTLLRSGGQRVQRIESFPGGRGLAVTLAPPAGAGGHVVLLDLASRDTTTLLADGFDARYVNSGHLIYAHTAGALYAMPFDPRRLRPTGPPVPVLDDLAIAGVNSRFDISPNGTLVYAQGETAGNVGVTFARVTPEGEVEPYSLDTSDHYDAGLSPDGRMLAYTRSGAIWLYDTELGADDQLSFESANGQVHNPVWSPDGLEIVYQSQQDGDAESYLYVQSADGSGNPRRIDGTEGGSPSQWLQDGTILYFTPGSPDVYAVSSTGDDPPEPLLRAAWVESNASVSPDGRWLAFKSTEGGRAAIHLRRWPELTGKVEVSSPDQPNQASALVWSHDSRHIYFAGSPGGRLWEVTIGDGDQPEITVRDMGVSVITVQDIHPDGSLLVARGASQALTGADGTATPRLVVVSNWLTALRQRLGEGN